MQCTFWYFCFILENFSSKIPSFSLVRSSCEDVTISFAPLLQCWHCNLFIDIFAVIQFIVSHFICKCPMKVQLWLWQFLVSPCLHFGNSNQECELHCWPPFGVPSLIKSNWCMVGIVVIVNKMFGTIVAWNWFGVLEQLLNSPNLMSRWMILGFVKDAVWAHHFCYIVCIPRAVNYKLMPSISCW